MITLFMRLFFALSALFKMLFSPSPCIVWPLMQFLLIELQIHFILYKCCKAIVLYDYFCCVCVLGYFTMNKPECYNNRLWPFSFGSNILCTSKYGVIFCIL